MKILIEKGQDMGKLSPSVLAADFNRLGEQISIVEKTGADYLHIDVMDGQFVPSISFGMPLIRSVRKETSMFFDVHLMVQEPIRYIEEFVKCGADLITVHYEACKNLEETLKKISDSGVKVGLTIKPNTPVSVLEPYLETVDLVLIMSVEPGFGGQKFLEKTYDRLKQVKEMTRKLSNPPEIEVDGGVTLDNIDKILEAGADVIVAGSAVFGGNVEENTKKLLEVCRKYR